VGGRRAGLERIADLRHRQVSATRMIARLDESPERAIGVLRGRGFEAQAVDAQSLSLEAANGRGLDALEALRAAGVAIRSFEQQRPTLEEIFLNVVRGERHG
jgi:ABC-type uncharacterized transport system ATPase subunit